MSIQAFVMHQAGSIGGVPNPDHQGGLWPGGIIVYVNTDTMEVDHTSLIGGGSFPVEVVEETPEQGSVPPPGEEPTQTEPPTQEAFPQVTPVPEENINVQ